MHRRTDIDIHEAQYMVQRGPEHCGVTMRTFLHCNLLEPIALWCWALGLHRIAWAMHTCLVALEE